MPVWLRTKTIARRNPPKSCAHRNQAAPVQAGPGVRTAASVKPQNPVGRAKSRLPNFFLRDGGVDALPTPIEAGDGKEWKKQLASERAAAQRRAACPKSILSALALYSVSILSQTIHGAESMSPSIGVRIPLVVHTAGIGKSVMQLVLFDPPRRAKPLEKGHCSEHEARLRVVSRAPLIMGEIMAEICGSQIVEGKDNGARRRRRRRPAPTGRRREEGAPRVRNSEAPVPRAGRQNTPCCSPAS